MESEILGLIPLTIEIRNPSSTDKDWNPVPEIWTDPRRRIQNLSLSWISLHGMIIVFFPASIFLDVFFCIFNCDDLFYNDNDNEK